MKYIFVDESRINKRDRFQLFGSLWLPRDKQEDFHKKFWKLWDQEFPSRRSELKWTKISNKKLNTYKKFIELFAELYYLDFRCILLDNRSLDYKFYHDNDKELGFYKFLYFFLSRNIYKDFRYGNVDDNYQIFLDKRKMKKGIEVGRLEDLKNYINAYLFNHCNLAKKLIVKNVEALDSKKSPEIQIVDIVMGAIGYKREGFETSGAKVELVKFIEGFFDVDFEKNTPYLSNKVNIWEFRLKKKSASLPTLSEES